MRIIFFCHPCVGMTKLRATILALLASIHAAIQRAVRPVHSPVGLAGAGNARGMLEMAHCTAASTASAQTVRAALIEFESVAPVVVATEHGLCRVSRNSLTYFTIPKFNQS